MKMIPKGIRAGFEVLAIWTADQLLGMPRGTGKIVVDQTKYLFKLSGIRWQTFQRSRVCVYCGRVGTMCTLERTLKMREKPHFNLYAVDSDGTWVLMTRDHIVPRSKGGSEKIENMATACHRCNEMKKDDETWRPPQIGS